MNDNEMVKVPRSAATIGLRLITQALETLANGSAIKRHGDARLAFQAALTSKPEEQYQGTHPNWMNPGVGAQLAIASSQLVWAIGGDARLAAEVNTLVKALEDWAMDNPPPPLVGIEWGQCQRIADVPTVHEALEAFSGDTTGDAGVLVVKAVIEAAFALLTADDQRNKDMKRSVKAVPWSLWKPGDTIRYIGSGGDGTECHLHMTIGSDYFVHEGPDEHESLLVLDDAGDELSVLVGEFEFVACHLTDLAGGV